MIRSLPLFFICVLVSQLLVNDLYSGERVQEVTERHKQLFNEADAGSAAAQYEVGLLYEYGRGVEQNDSTAISWYQLSAAQHHPDAQYRLAVILDNGWGRPSDKEAAFKLYRAAASAGHELAQHDVAMMYFNGSGTYKSLIEAYKWLKIAVLNGSPLMQKHLNLVAGEMTSLEIKRAGDLAEEWQATGGISY